MYKYFFECKIYTIFVYMVCHLRFEDVTKGTYSIHHGYVFELGVGGI